jgi:steroid delta-isomerase-like uncharacterized protein
MAVPNHKETWSAQDGRAVAAMFTEDGVRVEAAFPGARLQGREEIARQCQMWMDATPGFLEHRNVTESADGRTVTVEWTYRGSHTGDTVKAWPPRGERVELLGVSVFEMRGELVQEERVYWDGATLLAGAGEPG